MTIRVAAIEVSHWHALNDAAYFRPLVAMPDVELVAIQDSDARSRGETSGRGGEPADLHGLPKESSDPPRLRRCARAGLSDGRDCQRPARPGLSLLDGETDGINAPEVEAVAVKAARLGAFFAVPLAQCYGPFAKRARELLAAGRFGAAVAHLRPHQPAGANYQAWDCAWMLDPAEAGGGCLRNLGPHGLDMFLHLTGEEARGVTFFDVWTGTRYDHARDRNDVHILLVSDEYATSLGDSPQ
jgi:hypothetical protein